MINQIIVPYATVVDVVEDKDEASRKGLSTAASINWFIVEIHIQFNKNVP